MRRRTTINLWSVITWANHNLKRSDISHNEQKGICMMLESILVHTGNYHGYQYINDNKGYPNYSRQYLYGGIKRPKNVRDFYGNIPLYIQEV